MASSAAVALMAVSWSSARPAFGHEFTVVLVSGGSPDSEDARRGFELAVDQSPDVSHAPGTDAGDHLGGVDVEVVAIEDGESRVAINRVAGLLDDGVSAVVVLLAPSIADAVASAAADRDTLSVVVADRPRSTSRSGSLLLRPRDPRSINERGAARATAALQEAFGEEPTRGARLGYDAGILLDKIVDRVGHALQPTEAVMTAALAADADLASSRVDGTAQVTEPGRSDGGTTGRRADIVSVVSVATAALLTAGAVGAVVVIGRRRTAR